MSFLDILVKIAAVLFVFGWAVIILDSLTNFEIIERIPSGLITTFGWIHNGVFLVIGIILLSGLIWRLATG